MNVLEMLAPQLGPYLAQIGQHLEEVDKNSEDQGITNTAMLITKRKDPITGKTVTFLSYVEKPESLKYVKDENGKPKVEGIENLFTMFK